MENEEKAIVDNFLVSRVCVGVGVCVCVCRWPIFCLLIFNTYRIRYFSYSKEWKTLLDFGLQ